MAQSIKDRFQASINSLLYTVEGPVYVQYRPAMAGKVNIGPDGFDKDQNLSHWIMKDLRGGGGIEEMDESVHGDRYWWTNCFVSLDGHILLPRLATALTLPLSPPTPTIVNADMELDANWTGGARSSVDKHAGTYSWLYAKAPPAGTVDAYQDLAEIPAGCEVTFTCWAKYTTSGDSAGHGHIVIDDGVGSTESTEFGGTSWTQITVTRTLDLRATRCRLILRTANSSGTTGAVFVYFDDAAISGSAISGGTTSIGFANFNSYLYQRNGAYIAKLNAAGDAFVVLRKLPATITRIIPSLNSCLYVFLGDTENYWYMSTAHAFTETNVNDAKLGVQWDAKLLKLSSTGEGDYATTPNSATPTWTTTGDITDIGDKVENLFVGKDASGDDVVYGATHSILKVLDLANTKWLDTALCLPDHPNGGKGACYFRDGIFLSYGLGIKKYIPSSTASISEVGLDKDGGLPAEYNGEIVKLVGDSGGNYMIALVDASQTAVQTASGVYAYDGRGWQCWWAPPSVLIEDCEDAWNQLVDGDVTASLDTTDNQVGSGSAKFVVADPCAAGDIIATELITSTDLSGCNYVSFRIKSSVALDASDLQLLLDDTASCASPLETLNIPAIAADTWTKVNIALANPSTDTGIVSVGLKMAVDKGAFTVRLDQIEGQVYNSTMHDAIVSSAYGYRLWYDCGGKIYYIDVPRGISNPKQMAGVQKYATPGIFLSSWFDGGTSAYAKLAKKLVTYAKNITTTETVVLKYRIDRIYMDRDTGWTTLDTLNTTGENGENIELLGSGAGSTFSAFQIRLDLARGTTNTNSPDIQALVLAYQLVTKGTWIFNFPVIIDSKYGTSPKTKVANLKTALELGTLVPLLFRPDSSTDTHYVRLYLPSGWTDTGDTYEGKYTLTAIEV